MKIQVWCVRPYILVKNYQHFRGPQCLHLELKMVEEDSSWTAGFFWLTQHNIPEDLNLQQHCC